MPKVLSPFDGKWNNQFLDLPERFLSQVVGISPDMSRALYDENGLSLWDYDRKVRIWHDETQITLSRGLILWSPESSMTAYASLYDDFSDHTLLIISRDGKSKSIVNKIFPVPGLRVVNISWSPNYQYLAIAGFDGQNLNILIYDISSEKYISQCPIAKLNGTWPSLIWSPDSSRIAISDLDSPILIFDVLSGDVLELVQRGRVSGWSDKFPVILP